MNTTGMSSVESGLKYETEISSFYCSSPALTRGEKVSLPRDFAISF